MKRFFQEAGGIGRAFLQFLKRHKGLVLWTVLVAVMAHGALLIHSADIYTDTETYATDIPGTLAVFAKVGRFGMVLSKRLFFTNAYTPFLSVLYMMVVLCAFCLVFDFCLTRWGWKEDAGFKAFTVIFNALFLSCPILAHQFYFTYQAFEIALAFLFCLLAGFSAYQYGYDGKSPLWGTAAVFFMVWAFSTYQVLVPFYIALNAVIFMIYYLHGRTGPTGSWWAVCVKVIALFLIGLAAYVMLSQVISRTLFHLDAAAHLTNSYSCWGNEPFSVCMDNIRGDIRRVMKREIEAYNRFYLPVTLVFTVFSLWEGLKRKGKGYGYYVLAVVLTVISTFLMTFLLGNYQIVRAQMVYPLVFAVSAALAVSCLCRHRTVMAAAVAFMLLLTLNQLKTVNRYYTMAHTVAAQDEDFARRVYDRTEPYRAGGEAALMPMVFVGYKQPSLPLSAVNPWDAMGISFFEIDHKNIQGSVRIARFMRCLGLETAEPSPDQYAYALEASADMPCWPSEGSVVAEQGIIIIKLSEPEEE